MARLADSDIERFKALIAQVDYGGQSLLSINDLTNDQVYALFRLARLLEEWKRSTISLFPGAILATLFFQPSTRTRMSFETAMLRLGGGVLTETTPLVSSSAAKEESLSDMMRVVSKYADVIVFRHPVADDARIAASAAEVPVINGGFGDWEHPTQALLDLYTLWRLHGDIRGVRVCIASPDLVAARTGHSMAYGLARLGAVVSLASPRDRRMPRDVKSSLDRVNGNVREVHDLDQDEFNELISEMDLVYLPGCSAPRGQDAEAFKRAMDDYHVRYETLDKIRQQNGRVIHVTHTLPRRAGEMDLRIDNSPHQQYFEAVKHSIPIRMALIASVLAMSPEERSADVSEAQMGRRRAGKDIPAAT